MVKKLRSLIQEKIPLESRVQIELISRRRDLLSKEKFQEVIKILQNAHIENIVPLGPGTNRYAFKLDGFVIKVAIDNDGRIDNMKEFKMAKRLYPHVIKVYEVSQNGTLLVCEYIQPFISYSEMCMHSTQIKKILTELSSVYLIGDVGINAQNYGNWGLRIGTNDPVCLDFAYVYNVSSELFKCIDVKCGGIMVPDEDFFALHCNRCKKRYTFQDVRARLANDIHKMEIGDLTEEGYLLSESGVDRELDSERSNYLLKNKKHLDTEKVNDEEEEVQEIPFIMEHEPEYYIQEDKNMSVNRIYDATAKMINDGVIIIPGVATVIKRSLTDNEPNTDNVKVHTVIRHEDDIDDMNIDTSDNSEESNQCLAFSGKLSSNPIEIVGTATVIDHSNIIDVPVEEIEPDPVTNIQSDEVVDIIPQEEVKPDIPVNDVILSPAKKEPNHEEHELFNKGFINNFQFAISKLSGRIGNWAYQIDLFEEVRGDVKDKRMLPEAFYKQFGNAVWNSLIDFCHFTIETVPNSEDNDRKYKKNYIPPEEISGEDFAPTAIFIERFWNRRNINSVESGVDVMPEYRKSYDDFRGIQPEWLKVFERKLNNKINISKVGMAIIVSKLKESWCASEAIKPEPSYSEPDSSDLNIFDTISDYCGDDETDEDEEELIFTSSPETIIEEPEKESEPEEFIEETDSNEDSEWSDDEKTYMSVYIYMEEKFDIIRVNSSDPFGDISIPLYTILDEIDVSKEHHSLIDDRNGCYDWLIHQVPDLMFRTHNPNKWIEFNNIDPDEEGNIPRFVILDKNDDEYIMALYYIKGIFIIDDEGIPQIVTDDEILQKLNIVISDATCSNAISHLRRSLELTDEIHDESYLNDLIEAENVDAEDDDELSETEEAAINALIGTPSDDDDDIDESDDNVIFTPIRKK